MIRIVIAEDEEDVRIRLAKYLNTSENEYTVIGQAEDGAQALEMVRRLHPDILLTDIRMPQSSGLELLHAVRETDAELPVIIISGYDEFSYAQEAMRMGVQEYLFKPFLPNELLEVLDKTKARLERQTKAQADWKRMEARLEKSKLYMRQRFFHALLRGRLGRQELAIAAGEADVDLRADWFCAGLLGTEGPQTEARALALAQTLEQMAELPAGCLFYPVVGEREHLLLFFACRGWGRAGMLMRLSEEMERLCAVLRETERIAVRCTLGRPYAKIEDLECSYKEALDTWRIHIARERCVQAYPLEPETAGQPGQESAALKEKLLFDLQMGEETIVQADLDALISCYAACSPAMGEQVSMDLLRLALQISELMRDAAEQEVAWSEKNLIGYLRQHFGVVSLWQARELLSVYIRRCCQHFAQRNAASSDKLAYRARMMIEDNLGNEDFDLETLAKSLYFSPTYIRQLFKAKVGESFSDYLFRRRMELAGQLLRSHALKVQEIAERTDYRDQRYFARCFKRFYHCTPTEYRNQE